MAEPPAATILSLALAENACARDLQRHAEVAVAEHLHGLALADGALGDQVLDADRAAVREQLAEPVQVDDLVLHAERVLEAAQLGQPHVQRHLPALEAGWHLVAGLGALGAATGRLALLAPSPRPTRILVDLAPGAGRR